jgi:hypothetical protein
MLAACGLLTSIAGAAQGESKPSPYKLTKIAKADFPKGVTGQRFLFLAETEAYKIYLDGSSTIKGVWSVDGRQLFGEFASNLLQFKTGGKWLSINLRAPTPELKVFTEGKKLILLLPRFASKYMTGTRKIVFDGSKVTIDTTYQFQETAREKITRAEHIGVANLFFFPPSSTPKCEFSSTGSVNVRNADVYALFEFDAAKNRTKRGWYMNGKGTMLAIKPENMPAKPEVGKEYGSRILLELTPAK